MPRPCAVPSQDDLIGAIYDAVADPGGWSSALQAITAAFEAELALLAVADTVHGTARFRAGWGAPEVLAPLMSDRLPDLPFYAGLQRMRIDTPVTVDMLYALQGPDTRRIWLDSRLNRDWARPNRLDDFFWVALMKQTARLGSVIVITGDDRRPISRADLARFARLAPHLRRAVTIGDLFEVERARAGAFRAVLDALACPVLLVGADLRLMHANLAAEARLAAPEGPLGVRQGRLCPVWAPAAQALAQAVAQGARAEAGLGPAGIGVPLAPAVRPAVAHVLPLARRDPAHRDEGVAAAVFVAEAGIDPLPAIEAVGALFGLTAAERRVAAQIAQGLDRAQIAAANAVSDGTVKSQLAAIYDKTGTGDKRTLARLIRDLTPPLRAPD